MTYPMAPLGGDTLLPNPQRARVAGEPDEAMDVDDSRKGLDEPRRFLIAVGEAAQMGARLELGLAGALQSLRSCACRHRVKSALAAHNWAALSVETHGPKKLPTNPKAILDEADLLVREAFQGDDQGIEASQSALVATRSAIQRRNRVVHDLWLVAAAPDASPGAVTRLRFLPGKATLAAEQEASDLTYFEQTVIDVSRVIHQVSSVAFLESEDGPEWPAVFKDMRPQHLALARGEFDLMGLVVARPWRPMGGSSDDHRQPPNP